MFTDFLTENAISMSEIRGNNLRSWGVWEHSKRDNDQSDSAWLTDGTNFVQVHQSSAGTLLLTRYFPNGDPSLILRVISEVFETKIYSEYQPQFWGFSSQEEWDAVMEKTRREADETYYAELMNFLQDKPSEIKPGTNGMMWALVAKRLVAAEPSLLLSNNREKLLAEIRKVEEADPSNKVMLSPREMEAVRSLFSANSKNRVN